METLTNICIALAVIVLIGVLAYIVFRIRAAVSVSRILKEARASRNFDSVVLRILKICFPGQHILHRVRIPLKQDPGARVCDIECMMISRGGVILIRSLPYAGTIENPFRGDWREFSGRGIAQFKNPLEINAAAGRLITGILQHENISNVPVKGIVVFCDNKVRFKNRIEQVMVAEKMVPYIKDFNKNRFLSAAEIAAVTRAVKKHMFHSTRASRHGLFQEDE